MLGKIQKINFKTHNVIVIQLSTETWRDSRFEIEDLKTEFRQPKKKFPVRT